MTEVLPAGTLLAFGEEEGPLPLLGELPGAVLLLDPEGVVLFLNRVAEERTDLLREDVVGRDLFRDVLPHLESEGLGARYRQGVRRHPWSTSWETTLPAAGGDRPVSIGVRSHSGARGSIGLLMVEDRSAMVSERRRRERAERLAGVGVLAAGAAHEINNPLASIKGFAQILARETLEPGPRQMLEVISQECTRVARIVDGLLAFARQQRISDPEPIDLSAVAEEVLALRRYGLETAGIAIQTDLDRALSPMEAERGSIQRIVLTLLAHAEVSLRAKRDGRRLLIRTRETHEGLVLHVEDNGEGIPGHRRPGLLTADGAGNPADVLGFGCVDASVRSAGGTLTMASAEGTGTTFTVRFPAIPPIRPAPEPHVLALPPAEPPRTVTGQPTRVLVADDESTLRLALAIFLKRHGCEVDQAADAHEAFRMAIQGEYDFAFVDVRMPGDGIDLLGRLDSSPVWEGRAVLMTGDHTNERVRDEIEAGRPYLTKPFDLMDAVRTIEELRNGGDPERVEDLEPLWTFS